MACPLETHWTAIKILLRYLSGTFRYGLLLSPSAPASKFSLQAYNDSNWASDPGDRRSTYGSCIYFGHNPVAWSSKKQSLVARSSIEAEYKALAPSTSELLWLELLLTELRIPFHTPMLL